MNYNSLWYYLFFIRLKIAQMYPQLAVNVEVALRGCTPPLA